MPIKPLKAEGRGGGRRYEFALASLTCCMHNKCMEIEFDATKNAANLAKHEVTLSEAENMEWDTLWAFPDERRHYGEERMVGFAYIGLRLYCVVYTDRGNTRRIISLRKANSREMKRYAEA